MQSTRVKLYLLVAGLFDQPEEACADFHFSLIAKLLQTLPAPWSCRQTLEALECDVVENAFPVEMLDAEYQRLFAHGGLVSPCCTNWLDRSAADEVRRLMARHGVGGGETPDLVSELEFMAYLIADDAATRPHQRHFLQHHLGRWIPYFSQAVRFAAHLPRYRLAAELLERLVLEEIVFLNAHSGESMPHCQDHLRAA